MTSRPPTRVLVAVLLVVAVSGCASATSDSVGGHTDPSTASVPSPSSSLVHHKARRVAAVPGPATSFSIEDASGDRAHFVVTSYKPRRASSLPASVRSICAGELQNFGYSMARAQVVSFAITGTVTSSLATTIGAGLAPEYLLSAGGDVADAFGGTPAWWALDYSSGSECVAAEGGDADVTWQDADPHSIHSWVADLIVPNAITPLDPSGSYSTAHDLAIRPRFSLTTPQPGVDPEPSKAVVSCNGNETTFSLPWYVAVDPVAALADGCTRWRG